MSGLVYRQFFQNTSALRGLGDGEEPDLADLRRRLFVDARDSDRGRPDHFYRGWIDRRLSRDDTDKTLAGLILKIFKGLSDRYFLIRGNSVRPKRESFADWQKAVTAVSPLAVQVDALRRTFDPRGDADSFNRRLALLRREMPYTAIPSPHVPAVQDIIDRDGLNEMHMHLNGATETDKVWIDMARRPKAYLHDFSKGFKGLEYVKEQYEQIEAGLTPLVLYRRLRAARRVRGLISRRLAAAPGTSRPNLADMLDACETGLSDGSVEAVAGLRLGAHPLYELSESLWAEAGTPLHQEALHQKPLHQDALHQEALWLWAVLAALDDQDRRDRDILALGLYFQFLVMYQVTALTVQQLGQNGFDQFQKITLNESREKLEKKYEGRFFQLGVTDTGDHGHLEGRFAPKKDPQKMMNLLHSIAVGFAAYRGCPRAGDRSAWQPFQGAPPACLTGDDVTACPRCDTSLADPQEVPPRALRRARLTLVGHFIKQPDQDAGPKKCKKPCRHYNLRGDLVQSSRALREILKRKPLARSLITGIDAASNELDAPPEVFAPTYRLMRRAGVRHATYHAGEDFHHLVSGIRAVWEAVEFCDLRDGDRIGHATALGIDPTLWHRRIGQTMVMSKQAALDDAVFAHARLSRRGGHDRCLARLHEKIACWASEIYDGEDIMTNRPLGPVVLHEAWRLRHLDAYQDANPVVRDEVDASPREAGEPQSGRMDLDSRAEVEALMKARRDTSAAFALFRRYHEQEARQKGAETVEIEVGGEDALYDMAALHALQQDAVAELNHRHVVIETLPTSNVRISFYDSYAQHHLFRWLGLTAPEGFADRHFPTVCVGSDDTGIFATNMRNEFIHLYEVLHTHYGLRDHDAVDYLRRLNDNGWRHRFQFPVQIPLAANHDI